MRFKVYYNGFYIVESDSYESAVETNREDVEVTYEEWEKLIAVNLSYAFYITRETLKSMIKNIWKTNRNKCEK